MTYETSSSGPGSTRRTKPKKASSLAVAIHNHLAQPELTATDRKTIDRTTSALIDEAKTRAAVTSAKARVKAIQEDIKTDALIEKARQKAKRVK